MRRNKVISAEAAAGRLDGDTVAVGGFVGDRRAGGARGRLEARFPGRAARGTSRSSSPPVRATGQARGLQPFRRRGHGAPGDRRALGARAGARPARDREQHRGVLLPAGRDLPPVPRHRRAQAGHDHQGGTRARSSTRGSTAARSTAGRAEDLVRRARDRRRGVPVLPGVPDQRRPHPGHHRGSRRATSPWSVRRSPWRCWPSPRRCATPAASSSPRSSGSRPTRFLSPQAVKMPGILVDAVVVAAAGEPPADLRRALQPGLHRRGPASPPICCVPLPLDERKVIARRAAMFLTVNSVVNLGIGMPEGVATVANEEGVLDLITLTVEPGGIGGIPAGRTVLRRHLQPAGDHRPADHVRLLRRRRPRPGLPRLRRGRPARQRQRQPVRQPLAGAGGFINISQNAQRAVLPRHLLRRLADHRRRRAGADRQPWPDREVRGRRSGQVTFSGERARRRGQTVHYITERCVFAAHRGRAGTCRDRTRRRPAARHPRRMEFPPIVRTEPKIMDPGIFCRG